MVRESYIKLMLAFICGGSLMTMRQVSEASRGRSGMGASLAGFDNSCSLVEDIRNSLIRDVHRNSSQFESIDLGSG